MAGLLACSKGDGLKHGAGGADGAVNPAGGIASGGAGGSASADGGLAPGDAGVGGSRSGSVDGGTTNGGSTGNRSTSADGGFTTGGAAGNRSTSADGGFTTGGAAGNQSTSLVGGITGSAAGVAGSGGAGKGGASGTGEASLVLDKSRLDFDSMALGNTMVENFTLTNRGGSTSGIPSINVSPINGSATSITVKGCAAALAPGASCTLTVTVTPTALGLLQSFVHITADPGTRGNGSSHLSILVVGWAIGFEVSPLANIDLGTVATGTTFQRSLTVSALIPLSDLTVRTSCDALSIDTTASNCTATLAKRTSCVIVLGFNAPTVGWKEGALGIRAGGDMGQLVSIPVTANVSNAKDLSVDPKDPVPYVCAFEKTSPPVVFTITNIGGAASATIVTTLTGARDFRISDSTCTTLAPQATCTVSVVCSPPMSASAATRKAVLSISDGNTHLAVPVSGEVRMN